MNALGVIPARYGSTRLPAKLLIEIQGRPLLEWVIRGVRESKLLSELIVATDHEAIAQLAKKLGVTAVMTDPHLPSGSDRVWAAVQNRDADIVLSIQGDEPLIKANWVDQLIQALAHNQLAQMATLANPLRPGELNERSVVKVILNGAREAIYFSRHAIPYTRVSESDLPGAALKHVGVYAYKKDFLKKFCSHAPVLIEKAESLEQLRALYLGAKIQVVEIAETSIGVDTPEDVIKVSEYLKEKA